MELREGISSTRLEVTLLYFGYLGSRRLVGGSWHVPSGLPCWQRKITHSWENYESLLPKQCESRNPHFHRALRAVWKFHQPAGFTLLSPSPARLQTRGFAESSPFPPSQLTWRRAGLFNGVSPWLPPACRVSGNHGFPAAFHIRLRGLGKAATMRALCACVCTSGERCQDLEWESTRGPTADSSCQTSCPSAAGEAVCLWLAGKRLMKGWKLGSTVCPRNRGMA